jgi:glycogen debranching enzyme
MKAHLTSAAVEAPEEQEPEYRIEAHGSLVERPLKVLKHGEAFAVLDSEGDCGKLADTAEGIYYRDTRYLSKWDLSFLGRPLLLLSSMLHDDNSALSVALTNPDLEEGGFARNAISVSRTKFVWGHACYERIGLRNFDLEARDVNLSIGFDADFKDLFEVRGMDRARRGKVTKRLSESFVVFDYSGLDHVDRETRVEFEPAPSSLSHNRASFRIPLAPGATATILAKVQFSERSDGIIVTTPRFGTAYRQKRRDARAATDGIATVESSNDVFNDIMCRSTSDISMLLTKTEDGVYPHAGIPWYSTVFGRDGLITALLCLWVDPLVARGVLLHLASMQAQVLDASKDAQPGKILHEQRLCEMARTGEVPFSGYYGTVDATPLFVALAGYYCKRTGDLETIARIWSNIIAAMRWCDEFGDRDGDGFVEYFRETPDGLANQGWKDSHDSIFHDDGQLAKGPIALAEVQAYVYEAKLQAAMLAAQMGEPEAEARWRQEAADLKARFNENFWIEELGTYALALDGAKRPCKVVTSNAGHVLMTNIAPKDYAARVADTLLSSDMFSGWGVRTVSTSAARYNPMSYHNGSVWPHDNALIALGLGRCGLKAHALRIFEGLYRAQSYQPDRRLPELFCGFPRKRGRGPVSYPVSCSPQAWAAATPFALLAACVGLEIDHARRVVEFNDPVLPSFLNEVTIRNLRLGNASMDVRLTRYGEDVALHVLRRSGDIGAIVRK